MAIWTLLLRKRAPTNSAKPEIARAAVSAAVETHKKPCPELLSGQGFLLAGQQAGRAVAVLMARTVPTSELQ